MELLNSNLFLAILTTTILLLCFIILRRHANKLNDKLKLPPGRLGWPFIGETLDFGRSIRSGSMAVFMMDRMKRYSPKVFKTSLMGQKVAVLCGPVGHKFIFSNENKLVRNWATGPVKKILIPSDLDQILTQDPLRWRKLESEFFKPYAIRKYAEIMDYTVRQNMENEWSSSSVINVVPLAKKLTFTIAWRLFMGIEDTNPHVVRMENQFETVVAGLYSGHINLPGTSYNKALKAADLLRGEIQNIIRKHKIIPSACSQVSSTNLLAHLLSATDGDGKLLSEKEIASMLIVNLLASHSTTSSVFTSLVYYLSQHPHVYAQALQEQITIKNSKGGETLLTWEDTKKMKYCRNVIYEVLRLASPSNGTFREALHDISFEGFTIPKGWKIFWSPYSTNKVSKYFPNPDVFDPTRYKGDGPAPYVFTPFGGGPRMCPGNEFAILATLVFMHNLLTKFKWETPIVNEKVVATPPSPPFSNGLQVKLQQICDV